MSFETDLLKHLVRQNDRIIRLLSIDLDVDEFNLERSFEMARSFEEVKAALAAETDIVKAMRIQITHNNDVMDDIAAQLKKAGTNQAALDALYDNITSNSAEMNAGKEDLIAAALRDTPFDPSAQT